TEDFATLKQTVLKDFVDNVAIPQYQGLSEASVHFNNDITALNTAATEKNLAKAKASWRDLRTVWEQCEGFLFGPVEDDNYDPYMDTWPVDYVQLDSLIASSNPLTITDIQNLSTLSLRGFHPVEYVLWGVDGNRTAASITAREKKYMVSLSQDLLNNTTALSNSWITGLGNFGKEVKTAGSGSTVYAKKQEVFLAITQAMADICDEVGTGKMAEPFNAFDSSIVESPFSNNSVTDFKNNIVGLGNVYNGTYTTSGKGITDLVAAKNVSLDNKIKQQIAAAINSFDAISVSYELAIFNQRTQITNTMRALATLQATLEDELKPFMVQYITD
ncbi:MAG: imelysin, partial [Bacteroidota bacterium]|nr:imelysin [Bacteroidota bacterium]